ncbi:MAG: acyltransferase [Lautropia sp.]|nr:acyltransferase [Lautropia sp.]
MNQLNPSSEKKFIASLHGLRGIAVLYVLLAHLGGNSLFLVPIPHGSIGKVGVWIFFSLSAFLLTSNLLRESSSASSKWGALLQYAVHRVFRIYPLLIVVLVFYWIRGDISATGIVENLLLVEGEDVLWAIPVEFQYYLIIPMVVAAAVRLSSKPVCRALLAVSAASLLYGVVNPGSVFSNGLNIFPKIVPFCFGSMLALASWRSSSSTQVGTSGRAHPIVPWASVAGLLFVTVLYRFVSIGELSNRLAPWVSLAIGAAVCGTIYSSLHAGALARFLSARPLVYLGKISFSIYLLHMFVIHCVRAWIEIPASAQGWLVVALTMLIASLSYRYIERPGIEAGRVLGNRLQAALIRV